MNKKILVSALIAAFMACGTSAFAQDRHERNERNERNDNGPQQHDQRGERHDDHARPDHGNHGNPHAGNRGVGPRHNLYQGNRLPPEYRNRKHVVNDWRARRLSAPPRGHQWVKVDNDYVLMAAATGLIAQIILSN